MLKHLWAGRDHSKGVAMFCVGKLTTEQHLDKEEAVLKGRDIWRLLRLVVWNTEMKE